MIFNGAQTSHLYPSVQLLIDCYETGKWKQLKTSRAATTEKSTPGFRQEQNPFVHIKLILVMKLIISKLMYWPMLIADADWKII